MRKKRNKRKKVQLSVPDDRTLLACPNYALEDRGDTLPHWSTLDIPKTYHHHSDSYIEVGMVIMLNNRAKSLRRGGAPLHLENLRK
jgi:hypothetical protein